MFVRLVDSPRPAAVAVLFPYAGGGARCYRGWHQRFPKQVSVLSIALPGRESRYNERFKGDLQALAGQVAASLTDDNTTWRKLPMFFFGHSFGALVAFEVARSLEVFHGVAPDTLFLSGRPAAQIVSPMRYHTWSEPEFAYMLREMAEVGGELISDVMLMSHYLPIVRADFRLLECYRCSPDAITAANICAMAGTSDALARPADVYEWEKRTRGNFEYLEFNGGHFFINDHEQAILSHMGSVIAERMEWP